MIKPDPDSGETRPLDSSDQMGMDSGGALPTGDSDRAHANDAGGLEDGSADAVDVVNQDGDVVPFEDAGAETDADSASGTFWYADCDDDGYAASRVGRVPSRSKPAATAECFNWTTLEPIDTASTDCDDRNGSRYPGAGPGLPLVGGTLPEPGTLSYDLNCDGIAEVAVLEDGSFATTGIVKNGKLETLGDCQLEPRCPAAEKTCIATYAVSTTICGERYPASVVLEDARCLQTIDIYLLCR